MLGFRNGWLVLLPVNSICICAFADNHEKSIVRHGWCEKITVRVLDNWLGVRKRFSDCIKGVETKGEDLFILGVCVVQEVRLGGARCEHTSSAPHYTHSQGFGELSHSLRPAHRSSDRVFSSACENPTSRGSEGYWLRGIRMYEFESCLSHLLALRSCASYLSSL